MHLEDLGRQLQVGLGLLRAVEGGEAACQVVVGGGRLDGVAAEGLLPDPAGPQRGPRGHLVGPGEESEAAEGAPDHGRVRVALRQPEL